MKEKVQKIQQQESKLMEISKNRNVKPIFKKAMVKKESFD
jgi:hypothetical protein